ncbi:MAG: iron ABC transporter permease [Candidimonas sp.]|nr:MAG: iron ABC transporter permease [Candidimonas sp.]
MAFGRSRRHGALSIWFAGSAGLPAVLISLPLVYVVMRAVNAGLAGIHTELFRSRTLMLLINTLVITISVTVAASLIGLAVAWCVERTNLPGKRLWRIAAGLPLAMPAFVSSYAWSSISPLFQGIMGAILILSLSSYPLVYLPVAAGLRGADPGFEDVARSLGDGPWRCFFRAVLPQLRPALGGGALLVLTHMLAEFGAFSMLRVQTFTTAIFESYQLQFDSASAALQSIVLMALCLPAAYGEMRLRAGASVARVGRGTARAASTIRLGGIRYAALAGFVALIVLALGVPLTTLGYWLAVGRSAGEGYVEIVPAIGGTVALASAGAVITSLFAIPLVLLSLRHKGWPAQLADRLPYVIHGLPGVVVALAMVFMSIHLVPQLYQGATVLLLAYAILFLPLAQSSLRASAELVPPQLETVARGLGRSPFAAFLTVTLPNIAPGIGAALALMVLEIARELPATLMLAPTGVVTLATEVWSHTYDAEYAAAAPFAALLVLVSIVPVYFFTQRFLQFGESR